MGDLSKTLEFLVGLSWKNALALGIAALISSRFGFTENPARFVGVLFITYVLVSGVFEGISKIWRGIRFQQQEKARLDDPLNGLSDFAICVIDTFVRQGKRQFLAQEELLEQFELSDWVHPAHIESRKLERGERLPFMGMGPEVRLYEFPVELWTHFTTHRAEIEKRRISLFATLPQLEKIKFEKMIQRAPQILKDGDKGLYGTDE